MYGAWLALTVSLPQMISLKKKKKSLFVICLSRLSLHIRIPDTGLAGLAVLLWGSLLAICPRHCRKGSLESCALSGLEVLSAGRPLCRSPSPSPSFTLVRLLGTPCSINGAPAVC